MERAAPKVPCGGADKVRKPRIHLPRRLIGKGDGKNVPRRRIRHRKGIQQHIQIRIAAGRDGGFQLFHRLFVGRRRNHVALIGVPVFQYVCNPIDEKRRFSRTGTGKHKQRAFHGVDRFSLLLIEKAVFPVEERSLRRKIPSFQCSAFLV